MTRLMRHLLGIAAFTGILAALCGVNARAQGSRKDDIVFNAQGRPMAGATVRVCTSAATGQPCTPLALIYSDAGLTQALANPTATDGMGNYTFYAAPGRYEIEISGPSITTKQLPNVILPNDPSTPTFTTVTSTSGISAFSLSLSGNLTVSGSAAVTGSLTVGGAPVPSTNEDNQWTASQHFKGPDPWRDITAYMPAGGCANSGGGVFASDAGTITGGTNNLSISSSTAYTKNGCGIFISGVGPASTLATPSQGTAPNPSVIGTAGSTTVHYKVAAIDANYGTSAASAALTVTTAPSTRTAFNYVGIYWDSVANAVGYLVYTDQTGGGTYVPLTYSFDCATFSSGQVCGTIDKGVETFSWSDTVHSFWPTTPPGSATNQALITTIVSGAGSTSLVLAANATNSGSGVFTLPDASPFIGQAISDAENDGGSFSVNTGVVFIPPGGLYYTSTIPFGTSAASMAGVKIILGGALNIFGLPVEGSLGGGVSTGYVSITGTGGMYGSASDWRLSCSNITGYPSLGALFVVNGPGGDLDLSHVCLIHPQTGIVEGPLGEVTTQDVTFVTEASGPALQVDNNVFFSLFDRTNWNDSANASATGIPSIWFLGLTNVGHISEFDFRDNSFIGHTIRYDNPVGGGAGDITFSGRNDIEGNWDPCFICLDTNSGISVSAENVTTGDVGVAQLGLIYAYDSFGLAGSSLKLHGQAENWPAWLASAFPPSAEVRCPGAIVESNFPGGTGTSSLGYWGNIFGSYNGCDIGITQIGPDVQTTEVLTSGGNDGNGPAGEQIIGHVFRRPQASVSSTGSGSLSAGTYYIRATVLDVAGRQSAPSPEISQVVGASSSISLSVATAIYYPASCNIYFGTSPGSEANYFNSATVSNGTCTFTLTTTSGETSGSPAPVGNAMRSWLSEENNASSCLFCGLSGGLGTGFLGFNLTAAQYAAPPTGAQFPFNGGVHSYKFYSASETTAPAGIASVDELYADSTAHRWKKIENNGAVETVGSADSSACAYQGPASAVTGTGAAATYFTCTLPAGVMGAGQGIILTVVAKHTTGTATVSYTLSFGGTSTTAAQPGGAANQLEHLTYLIMNNPGSTSAQTISTVGQDSNAGNNSIKLDTAAVSTASAVTINVQFNVASTDAITPEMFLVELKQ